jgi:hypothetical protein
MKIVKPYRILALKQIFALDRSIILTPANNLFGFHKAIDIIAIKFIIIRITNGRNT